LGIYNKINFKFILLSVRPEVLVQLPAEEEEDFFRRGPTGRIRFSHLEVKKFPNSKNQKIKKTENQKTRKS